MTKTKYLAAAIAAIGLTGSAWGASFVNGGFEDGNLNGWTIGGGSRGGQNLSTINPADYLPGGSRYNAGIAGSHSALVTPGAEPQFPALMPSVVYSGGYALRVEDRTTGGYVSVASQTVNNYTDASIYFAWLAVLENGGHTAPQSAAMIIQLQDLTAGDTPILRVYNAVGGGGGVDSRFNTLGNYYYTPLWQIEQLTIDASRMGHDFTLTVLASDCAPTGHEGYVYLDGFGAAPPPVGSVPVPGALALLGIGALGLGLTRRKA